MRWAKRLGAVAAALLLIVLGAWLLRAPILRGVGHWLNVGQAPARAELIYLFGGDIESRPARAATLYREGWAPRIVIARVETLPAEAMGLYPHQTDVAVRLLRHFGVPDSAITVLRTPGGVTSTRDEAVLLAAWLRRHPARRVLAVTSRYHTRRARWHLRRALGGTEVEVRMIAAADPRFGERDWWRSEDGLIAYVNEYLKWAQNWAVG